MARDFSYMFYPGDVLRDTQFFTPAQKGCYLDVLNSHIENISFSYDFLMKITRCLSDVERAEFLQIFTRENDGYFIDWVVSAIKKRSAFIQSRGENKKGKVKKKRKKDMKIISKSYDSHMEKEYKEENKEELVYPFNSEIFKKSWQTWIDYKKIQYNFSYKSGSTEQIALNELAALAERNELQAIEIINTSITNGWKGLFKKQNNQNGKSHGRDARREPNPHGTTFGKL